MRTILRIISFAGLALATLLVAQPAAAQLPEYSGTVEGFCQSTGPVIV